MPDQHHSTDADHTNLLTLDTIRELIALVNQANISELLIERDGTRLHIKRQHILAASQASAASMQPPPQAAQRPEPGTPPETSANLHNTALSPSQQLHVPGGMPGRPIDEYILKAPLVGMFHSAPEPSSSPFVAVGDTIAAGDTVCLIESLQIMHPVDADRGGQIVHVLVQDGQAVEYGQPLMVLTPVDSL
jgi:acetyl-CoA carboxylase biotin carboxyl carrier protein